MLSYNTSFLNLYFYTLFYLHDSYFSIKTAEGVIYVPSYVEVGVLGHSLGSLIASGFQHRNLQSELPNIKV